VAEVVVLTVVVEQQVQQVKAIRVEVVLLLLLLMEQVVEAEQVEADQAAAETPVVLVVSGRLTPYQVLYPVNLLDHHITWLVVELVEVITVHLADRVVVVEVLQEFLMVYLEQQARLILVVEVVAAEVEQFLHKVDLVLLL